MAIRERLSGNEAVATAMKQINPDTVAAYPITPSTEVPQYFSNFVANGDVTTEFIAVESEHLLISSNPCHVVVEAISIAYTLWNRFVYVVIFKMAIARSKRFHFVPHD